MRILDMPSFQSIISEPSFPVMAGAALITVILTAIALPLGVVGFAATLYLHFLCRPLLPSRAADGQVVAPAEGMVVSVARSANGTHICIQQRWDARLALALPVSGRIEQNLFIDGAYLPQSDPASEVMNAKRELHIETIDGDVVELIQRGTPTSRILLSSAVEGQALQAGTACGLSIFAGVVEMVIPHSYQIDISIGVYCVAGQTIMASRQAHVAGQ